MWYEGVSLATAWDFKDTRESVETLPGTRVSIEPL